MKTINGVGYAKDLKCQNKQELVEEKKSLENLS